MLVTITEFAGVHADPNGTKLPIGGNHKASQTLAAAGNSAAMQEATGLVRIATDTAITVDVYDGDDPAYMPADSVEFFPVAGGQVIAVAAV